MTELICIHTQRQADPYSSAGLGRLVVQTMVLHTGKIKWTLAEALAVVFIYHRNASSAVQLAHRHPCTITPFFSGRIKPLEQAFKLRVVIG